ncbi:hypothetical protein [Amycolatopsis sp. NPDC098790]|uniref:hypothetical protein n=1 Tax=Amycolatopsis sp. NPDC098790 TaxID=3363939 RepID=UPI0037F2F66D
MARLLAAQEAQVPVTYGMFGLLTGAGGDPLADEHDVAVVTPGGVGFFSAGRDHTATVRLEFWDSEPEAAPSQVETVTGIATIVPSPAVVLVTVDTGYSRDIPTPFTGDSRVEVSCSGREEAERLTNEEHEMFYEDVERWLVRMWPDEQRLNCRTR